LDSCAGSQDTWGALKHAAAVGNGNVVEAAAAAFSSLQHTDMRVVGETMQGQRPLPPPPHSPTL